MYKWLTNKQGSALMESLVGMMILSFVVFFLFATMGEMYMTLQRKQKEVEAWRLMQDTVMEQTPGPAFRESGGWQFQLEWLEPGKSCKVETGNEVYVLEMDQS